jgi:CubicO group peptidase (beta-lactamase class C family)
MTRTTIFLLLLLSSCNRAPFNHKYYFGILKQREGSYRLYLDLADRTPQLQVVGMRGYPLPLKNISIKDDHVSFERSDEYARFAGVYNKITGGISGIWISDDTVSHPLDFVPVLRDTIKGLFPRPENGITYQRPPYLEDGINVAGLGEVQLDSLRIHHLLHDVVRQKYGFVHALLIARKNRLVVEEYFYGFPRDAHFGIQSATKSFVSALAGIAFERNEIPSPESSLCGYLPRYGELLCDNDKPVTLHQLMSMSTGFEWDEITHQYGDERNSAVMASAAGDELSYLFTRRRADHPTFAYNSLNHLLMNRVLKQSTHLENSDEMKWRLLDPLGITHYDLGDTTLGVLGDIFLRPRDMLKFGLLYVNKGEWNGRRILPAQWVETSTEPKIRVNEKLGYGYFWWTRAFDWKGKQVKGYFAWGYGGQYIFVIPELELVVVFIGTNWTTDLNKYYMDMMDNYVIPSSN